MTGTSGFDQRCSGEPPDFESKIGGSIAKPPAVGSLLLIGGASSRHQDAQPGSGRTFFVAGAQALARRGVNAGEWADPLPAASTGRWTRAPNRAVRIGIPTNSNLLNRSSHLLL